MTALQTLAARLAKLSGFRRFLGALSFGLLTAAALPPVYAVFLLIPAFTGLLWLLDGAGRARRAFFDGWSFGLGFFAAGLYWIAHAMLVDPEQFAWMIPFAIGGLSGFLAIFIGAITALLFRFGGRGPARILLFAALWGGVEMLRGFVFTGFPWNLLASVWGFSDSLMQPAALVGAYGLSMLTVLAASMPALLATSETSRRQSRVAVLLAFGLLAAGGIWGAARLATTDDGFVADARLRLVQANVDQALKWKSDLRRLHFLKHVELSQAQGEFKPNVVIWPETAVAFSIDYDEAGRDNLRAAIPENGLLITGAPRITPPGAPFRVWNSLQAVNGQGRVVGGYDKFHLVPFGEYIPLRQWLPLPKLTQGTVDFSAGSGPQTLRLPGLPSVSPLICYEIIFPGAVIDRKDRPEWMLNVTNDGWFGLSSGPYQHLVNARFRAVEEGLPLVRAANTGISAIIDAQGRIKSALSLGSVGFLDGYLPKAAAPTLYARFDGNIPLALLVIFVILGISLRNKNGTP